MDTHVHVVAESAPEPLERAMRDYARWFNRRHLRRGPLLRGPVAAFEKRERAEVVRAIRYTHANPLKTTPPLVARAFEFPWSGEREYVGLSCAGIIDLERVRGRAGFVPALSPAPGFEDAERRAVVTWAPPVLVGAAAQAFAVHPDDHAGPARYGAVAEARALAVALGVREGYEPGRMAPYVGRSRVQVWRIATRGAPERAIRVARTLVADERLRARIAPAVARPKVEPVVDELVEFI